MDTLHGKPTHPPTHPSPIPSTAFEPPHSPPSSSPTHPPTYSGRVRQGLPGEKRAHARRLLHPPGEVRAPQTQHPSQVSSPTHPPTHPPPTLKPHSTLIQILSSSPPTHPPTHPPTQPHLIRFLLPPTHPPPPRLIATEGYGKPLSWYLNNREQVKQLFKVRPTHPPTRLPQTPQHLIPTASFSSTFLPPPLQTSHSPNSQHLIPTASFSSTQPTHAPTHPLNKTALGAQRLQIHRPRRGRPPPTQLASLPPTPKNRGPSKGR